MAIQHYDGELGVFDYDDEIFELDDDWVFEFLHYVGKETDGSKIHIPEGIVDCCNMFEGCDFLETPPSIPDGVISCQSMFDGCKLLRTPSIIPNGVKDCSSMFHGCYFLQTPPIIPDGVKNCEDMFGGCVSLEIPPIIPDSVECCYYMFANCCSLKNAPEIPNSVDNCSGMFRGCKKLKNSPIIPNSVEHHVTMFTLCSDEIQKAGEWNIDHRGQSYEKEIIDKKLEQYGLFDVSKHFDLPMKIDIADLGDKCKDSNSCYNQVLDDIKNGFITDFESLKQEIEAMDKCIEQMNIDKRNKQVSSEFGDMEQIDNFEQQMKDIVE